MSQTHQPFHPLSIPIHGTSLIEASAGTGKTYGIAALFTRFIVLEHMPVESILVVTFTKAATAELKTRLRTRLDDVLQILESVKDAANYPQQLQEYCQNHYPHDDFLSALLTQALLKEKQERLVIRLKAAINHFDNAAIYTIHGFCQRILRDYAFLCQAPFELELTENNQQQLLIHAQDFWREHISNHPLFAPLVFKYHHTPQSMLAQIQSFISRPYLSFRRPQTNLESARRDLENTWQTLSKNLDKLEHIFWEIYPVLNGTSYRNKTFIELFSSLNQSKENNKLPSYHEKLFLFSSEELTNKTKKGKSLHSDYIQLQALANLGRDLMAYKQTEEDSLISIQLDLLHYINQASSKEKKNRRERSFDDLLLDVHKALTDNPHHEVLAQAIAQNWQVALIDEFQDTDPLQYEIFSKIFIAQEKPLFLVGDPKQAIYSFRGADIYAYLQAANDATHHYTLSTNFRSHAHLINSISALFQKKSQPFILEHIDYSNVQANRLESRLNPAQKSVCIRWLNGQEAETFDKETLRKRSAEYCADEIALSLNQAAQKQLNFKGRPLQSGDIAVLVRTHNEGNLIAKSLKKRNIQSVLIQRESVFSSNEAQALAALIDFWLHPQHIESLRFTLSSILFAYNADKIYALNQNENELLNWIDSAQNALKTWQKHGIYSAMQDFSQQHHIEQSLLMKGQERSLTNYHQILERLAEENEKNHTPAALYHWLLEQIELAKQGCINENNILRLESDEALVKIVTLHASKGLQYPIVYCPFVWDAANITPADWQIIHRDTYSSELLSKQQLTDDDAQQLSNEEMSERLRLLYVGLTRAEEQLNIYAAYCSDNANNAFAYLLEGCSQDNFNVTQSTYAAEKKANKALGEMQMLKTNWQTFVEHAPADTDFYFTEEAPIATINQHLHNTNPNYQARKIPARTFEFIRHSSFTKLSQHTKTLVESPEELQPSMDFAETAIHNTEPQNLISSENEISIHHFPRGTNAGICLHEILEKLNFNIQTALQKEIILETLTRYGFEEKWQDSVSHTIELCRTISLTQYALSDIPEKSRLPEMAFTLYMQDFNLPKLITWFQQKHLNLDEKCLQAAQQLDFHHLSGFLNGFIDMVYQDPDGQVCIIDYKSNYLGQDEAAYTAAAMNEAIAEHHYYLQAFIYAIAVARYFKLRQQPLAKINIRYLFLRGLDNANNGVWQWNINTKDLSEWM